MRVMAQMSMIMNLDKCIGCHTCSVTCKQVWTNRTGVEYAWFNNVETRPGLGYPRQYEDQDRWKGGWERNKRGRLKLRSGGRLNKLAHIFNNPDLPGIDDYYEPWTYDYDMLTTAPAGTQSPVARPKSLLTGKNMDIKWSGNWDDDLGGSQETAAQDPILATMSEKVKMEFEETFMFYLPRICEHCLNPACVAACPSGAMYKREEDGIVLVDEDGCRGWRMCVSACPYKKVYFNHKSGKAEKCTLCYPLIEQGKPTICSETCVGRLRYLGLMLYDADAVLDAAAVENDQDLLDAQRGVFLDPFDPEVIAAAKAEGMADDWIEAAQNSPIFKLITEYKIALPLHPEYRTMPMVWYIPPLSPVVDVISNSGADGEDSRTLFAAIDKLRIPVEYLAGLFSAGDVKPVEESLRKLAGMRAYMRDINLGREADESIPASVGMTTAEMTAMYRLLAIAKYEDRYVIPKAHVETARELEELGCSLDTDGGPGMGGPTDNHASHGGGGPAMTGTGGPGPYGGTPAMPLGATVDNYNALIEGTGPRGSIGGPTSGAAGAKTRPTTPGRINLLNWSGSGSAGMFPPKPDTAGFGGAAGSPA